MVDEQLEIVRELARQYPRLQLLVQLPESLGNANTSKAMEDIRTVAIAYVLNEILDRTISEEELAAIGDTQKQKLCIPGTIVSQYIGIPVTEFDPMDLL